MAAPRPETLSWPLVGRDDELARIKLLRGDPQERGAVLTGPAGVGKSHLARHALAAAQSDGAMVRWVQATRSAAAVPLGAFAGLLPPDARSDDALDLMRGSAEALRADAAGRRVVLGVDDVQLLDPTSAALVLHLVSTGTVFVLATLRTGEPFPDAVQSLWKDAGVARLELRTLDEEETARLSDVVLGGPAEQQAQRWLFESSRGNVLYARELLAGALDQGALQERDGLWRLTRRPPPSRSLSELVAARMEGLDGDARRAVELLALGEPLRLAEAAELVGGEALGAAEAQGLITVSGTPSGSELRLAHPLYGEVLRVSMPVVRGIQARRQLASTLGARSERAPDDALRIARWLLDAGDPVPTELSIDAAGAAARAGDPDLASRFARMALDTGADPRASMLLARAHTARKRHEEAAAVLAGIEGELDDPALALQYVLQRSVVLLWGVQQPHDALAFVDRARDWFADPSWSASLAPLRVRLVAFSAGFAEGVVAAEELLADPSLDPVARRRTERAHITSLFYSGRAAQARDLVLERLPDVPLRDEEAEHALIMWCIIGIEAGWDHERIEPWMRDALDTAVRVYDHAAAGIAAFALGALALTAGRYTDAGRWLGEAVGHLELHDPFKTLRAAHAVRAGVAFHTGDREGTAAALASSRAASAREIIVDTDRAYLVRGDAWGALADGDPQRAQRLLLDAAASFGQVPIYAAQLYHEALRAGAHPRGIAGPLAKLRERCDAPMVAAYHEHTAARAAGDAAALLRCAGTFEAMGAQRYASECAADAAEAYAAEGRNDSARRAAARSRDLVPPGQGGTPPRIRGLDSASSVLTARELQLIELVGQGLTNAEIADRLVVSVRTVESHIYRAMRKLGVTDRRELQDRD
jgi:DNA-binding CsgD family transcriptional regulator